MSAVKVLFTLQLKAQPQQLKLHNNAMTVESSTCMSVFVIFCSVVCLIFLSRRHLVNTRILRRRRRYLLYCATTLRRDVAVVWTGRKLSR